MQTFIEFFTQAGETVLDPMAGTGSTLLACLRSGRNAIGSSTQKNRRAAADLDVFYSDDPRDLGNLTDYDQFLTQLCDIYGSLRPLMKERAYLTIIAKNIKKGGMIFPLAWDLARLLGESFMLKDERIWRHDNQPLSPYGMGSAWVSNTLHHYCLQFRKEQDSHGSAGRRCPSHSITNSHWQVHSTPMTHCTTPSTAPACRVRLAWVNPDETNSLAGFVQSAMIRL